jgi:propionyl-CoA carboxylase alpha chain
MGLKVASRERMKEANVPVVPGSHDLSPDALAAIGLPLVVKASAGGGGKGMRVVRARAELASAIESCRREAEAAFGDPTLYAERYLERPRHVEIQVLGDAHGRVVALGERECSLQRRHQKVIEESPSPVVGPELRARMSEAAVAAAKAVGYVNAGTVEFLLDVDGSFFFLEMNTRLQVEHPVTEEAWGLDLVALQLAVAAGEPLPADLPTARSSSSR